jgi:hypothetical protein
VRILIGSSVGIPASSLCITRRLYLVQLNPAGNAAITRSDKMRLLAIDLGISAGLPLLIMILRKIFVIFIYVTALLIKPMQSIFHKATAPTYSKT